MNMIGHYYEGVQVVVPVFEVAEFEATTDTIRHASIIQPERTCLGAIELLVDSREFLPSFHSFFGAQFSLDANRQRTVETPSKKDCVAFGQPVRQSAMVIIQGPML